MDISNIQKISIHQFNAKIIKERNNSLSQNWLSNTTAGLMEKQVTKQNTDDKKASTNLIKIQITNTLKQTKINYMTNHLHFTLHTSTISKTKKKKLISKKSPNN